MTVLLVCTMIFIILDVNVHNPHGQIWSPSPFNTTFLRNVETKCKTLLCRISLALRGKYGLEYGTSIMEI